MSVTVAGPCAHADDLADCQREPVSCRQLVERAGHGVARRRQVLGDVGRLVAVVAVVEVVEQLPPCDDLAERVAQLIGQPLQPWQLDALRRVVTASHAGDTRAPGQTGQDRRPGCGGVTR